jgi:lysophospholipase L1-like esterase
MRGLVNSIVGVGMCLAAATAMAASPFELRDGDRVAIVGGTFVEREGQFGWIETALTASLNDRKILFRNMGWSGDTVWSDSRGVFDAPEVGYQRLLDLITEFRPTVVLLAYGQNESFAGEAGLPAFVKQYAKLSSDVKAIGARLVYVTPLPFARPVAPLPDATGHNRLLATYSAAIRELAAKENAPVIDLQTIHWPSDAATRANPLSENGIHLTPEGSRFVAGQILVQEKLRQVDLTSPAVEALHRKVLEKNELFFHRWRPQNSTYLFGFRKHEQGNNAVEIPQFDPLIAKAEVEIARLKTAK